MIPTFNKVHNKFKLNSTHYNFEDLKEVAYSFVKEGEPYEKVTGDFLLDWLDNQDYITVNTSGSTGKPKTIKLDKQAMVNSAIATGEFFGLNPGDNAIDCLPSNYIAGKMMLVRAMILGLEIDCVNPTTKPEFNTTKNYDFCAMIPLQLMKCIDSITHIKTIIVGGAAVQNELLNKLKTVPNKVFETYGMTETVTHVAVKQLNTLHSEESHIFQALPNVLFSQDSRECLMIKAPHLSKETLMTNDVVKLNSQTSFEWIGRIDNVINSGGVKLFPEQIEAKLNQHIQTPFFIASRPDESLGKQLILVVENLDINTEDLLKTISNDKSFDKLEIPKLIFNLEKFAYTANGKINRSLTLESIKKLSRSYNSYNLN